MNTIHPNIIIVNTENIGIVICLGRLHKIIVIIRYTYTFYALIEHRKYKKLKSRLIQKYFNGMTNITTDQHGVFFFVII